MGKLKGRVRGEQGKNPPLSFRETVYLTLRTTNKQKNTPKKQPAIFGIIIKNRVTKAGTSFIDEASVQHYKKQCYSFTNSGKIATVNKIKKI